MKKGIYVRMLKSGSTSVMNGLRDYPSVSVHGIREHFKNDLKFLKKNQGFSMSARSLLLETWDESYKFTFVRNPWDRAISVWKQFKKDKKYLAAKGLPLDLPFGKFINMIEHYNFERFNPNVHWIYRHLHPQHKHVDWIYWHLYPQHKHVVDENGKTMVDFIGRFENLQKDFDHVCAVLDIPPTTLIPANQTIHRHYSHYYNKEHQNVIHDKFKTDIDWFNYKFTNGQEH